MERKSVQVATLCLVMLALFCWIVMFLAGTDVWHDLGRPGLSNLEGPLYHDLWGFVYAFYLLAVVLAAQFVLTAVGVLSARPGVRKEA